MHKKKKHTSSTDQILSPSDRLGLIKRVILEGVSVTDACRAFGVSRPTFYKWERRYESAGPSEREKLTALADKKSRRTRRSRQRIAREIEELIRALAIENPEWGKRRIHQFLLERGEKVGIHAVSNTLCRLLLHTPELRGRYSQAVRKNISLGRLLTAEERKTLVERVERGGLPVSVVCHDTGISRNTLYKWLRRYSEALDTGEDVLQALADRKRRVECWKTQASDEQERQVLDAVFKDPYWGKYRIARAVRKRYGDAALGIHGVTNVLRRNQLNTAEKRTAWAAIQPVPAPTSVSPITGWLDRLKLVFQQFIPTRAPAPPPLPPLPGLRQVLDSTWLKRFAPFSLFSLLLLLGLFQWGRLLGSAQTITQAMGWVFASAALSMGTVFFLYSLKYYFTLAVVLSFSRSAGTTSEESVRSPSEVSVPVSWLGRLFGLRVDARQVDPSTSLRTSGLEPDLGDIKLERYPFISIHLPMYNEKRVAERILKACTSFDYQRYEIIVADDSTDETTAIVERFAEQWNISTSGKSRAATPEVSRPRIKVIHRDTREGFKGGALKEALKHTDPRAEFIVVFDADFVPYPDTLELFLKYFQANAGSLHPKRYALNPIAAIQGYQWHVLNKSENWITRGVRSEYAGSYVIERSGEELYGGLKQIAGSVYMVRRDLVDRFGWGTSLTEDFQLTLRLYEAGYKVVYTPYIQAPSECVSTLKRLIRQRMRWAEGHSFNIRKMFTRLLFGHWELVTTDSHLAIQQFSQETSNGQMVKSSNGQKRWILSKLTLSEKLEFFYLSPYYLQAAFFLLGTISWLLSETIFRVGLPFWTAVWGWSLVLTNILSLPLMNTVGLFLEEAEERDFSGILSFVLLSYILVPFQAYASVKGFLEPEEGPWFRTPKTGKITDILTRGRFYRFIRGIFPERSPIFSFGAHSLRALNPLGLPAYVLSKYTQNSRPFSFKLKSKQRRRTGRAVLVGLIISALLLNYLSFFAPQTIQAQASDPTIEQQINIMDQEASISWYNTSWLRRKLVTITNNTASELTDFQVKLTVSYDSDMQDDFEDLRFTNSSQTLLDHWTETYTASTTATVWVEVDTIPASSSTTIYMYYDNDAVSDGSNGSNTFQFFDDFDTDPGYTKLGAGNGSYSVSSSVITATETSGGSGLDHGYQLVSSFAVTSGDHEVRASFEPSVEKEMHGISFCTLDDIRFYKFAGSQAWGITPEQAYSGSGLQTVYAILNDFTCTGYIAIMHDDDASGAAESKYDWVLIRKYVSSEPSFSFGSEEAISDYAPSDNSLGIIQFDPTKYSGETVYFEVVRSVDGSTWTRSRSSSISMPAEAKEFTVRMRVGDGSSNTPGAQLYNKTDSSSTSTITFGSTSDTSVYLKAARLIIVQTNSAPPGITDTQTQIEVGNNETTSSDSYVPLDDKKIYRYTSSAFTPSPSTYFEASLKAEGGSGETLIIEQQINIITQVFETRKTSYWPEDDRLGFVEWDSTKYTSDTVYFEAVIRMTTHTSYVPYAALYTSGDSQVSGSILTGSASNNGNFERLRSGALTLSNGTDYTVRIRSQHASRIAEIKAARLIVVQSDSSAITDTRTQVEVGNAQSQTSTTATQLTDKKIYNYDSSKFSPTPTAYFEASLQAPPANIEQQINILDKLHSSNNSSANPTDNSLGIVRWDADKYSGETVYFEAVVKLVAPNCCASDRGKVYLYTTGGSLVTTIDVAWDVTSYTRFRSSSLSLTDDTDYTVRTGRGVGSTATVYLKAARLIVIQSDPTKVTETQTQIEVGNAESQNSTSETQLTDKKIYYYDSSKFTPAPTAYFEAVLKGGVPAFVQQINIIDQQYSTTGNNVPIDNSLGLIRWDGSKYSDETVYLEAVIYSSTVGGSCSGPGQVKLYTSGGSFVTDSTVSQCTSATWQRLRSSAITLSDGTDYTVRLSANGQGTKYVRAARLIVVQSNSTKITETETQIEVGNVERQDSSSATQLTDKKIYYYDSSEFSPSPTAYFEASFRAVDPTIEQQINIIDQQYSTTGNNVPIDNSLGLIRWDGSKYSDETVYLEAVIYSSTVGGSCSGPGQVKLYTSGGSFVTDSTVSQCTSATWQRLRSSAITLSDGTDYTVRLSANGQGTKYVRAARLIVAQTDSTKITDTRSQIELGDAQSGFTNTSYSALTDYKVHQYDQDQFSATPESSGDVEFHASLKIDDSGDTVYAQLFNCGSPCNPASGQQVAELSHSEDTDWTLERGTNVDGDADWDTTNNDEYIVRVRCNDDNGGGCSGNIANAKIVLDQSAVGGLTDVELVYQEVNTVATDADTGYTTQRFDSLFSPDVAITGGTLAGGTFTYYYEATIKTAAGTTGYAELYNLTNSSSISSSELTTTNTDYERQRSSDISSNMPDDEGNYSTKTLDTRIKNSTSNTTSVASSWLIIQVSNLATSDVTAYADLYNKSNSTQVASSEVSTTSTSWTRQRSSSITLTTEKEYVVRLKSSSSGVPIHLANAKIILDQTAVGGITDVELVHQQINTLATDSDTGYSDQIYMNYYDPDNYTGAAFTYYFEATIKTSGGTGYAQLKNDTDGTAISGSEVETTNINYERQTSSDITSNMPSLAKNMDAQLKNSASNTTSASSSWLIIQVASLVTSGLTAYADLYNLTTTTQVSGSQVSIGSSNSWTRVRSSSISLTTDEEYVVRLWSSDSGVDVKLINAKIILDQTAVGGITDVEFVHHNINTLETDSDSTYTDKDSLNEYNPDNFDGATFAYFFEATLKTSNASFTAYAQLWNDTDGSVITSSEVTTIDTDYDRVRSADITSNMPSAERDMDTQLKNQLTDTTSVASSWLIIQVSNLGTAGFTATADLYNLTDETQVASSEVSTASTSWIRVRSESITLTTEKEYVVRIKTSSADNIPIYIANAKIVFDQTNPTTIADVELIHQQINTLATDADTGYTDQNYLNYFDPSNYSGGDFAYYFEATLKTGGGTGYAKLKDDTASDEIDNPTTSEVSETGSTYDREISSNLASNSDWPSSATNLDTIVKNSSTNTTSVSSSWLIIQVSNMTSVVTIYAALYEDGSSCTTQVSGSELSTFSTSWTRQRTASTISLSDATDYMVCVKTSGGGHIANAKIIHTQLDAGGITHTELIHQHVNTQTIGWYDTDWGYRKKITIESDEVSGSSDLSNFPVLINTTDTDWKDTGNSGHVAQADGGDILFTDADGNKLDHEIESYTETSGALVAWVEVPTLDYNDDTDIYIYYGNASVADQEDIDGTWNSDYKGAWHLDEEVDGVGGSDVYQDSTSNDNHGDDQVSATGQDGQIDGGQEFDGDNDYVNVPHSSTLNFGAPSDTYTISVWVKTSQQSYGGIVTKSRDGYLNMPYRVDLQADGTIIWTAWRESPNGVLYDLTSTTLVDDGSWHFITAVHNGASDRKLFVDDGSYEDSETNTLTDTITNSHPVYFGRYHNSGWGDYYLNGQIDEVRISNTARSAGWIATEYSNQSSPSGFYTVNSTEETSTDGTEIDNLFDPDSFAAGTFTYYFESSLKAANAAWYNTDWGYRKKITIESEKVSGSSNLEYFPVLINTTDTDWKDTNNSGHVGQADGGDILFTSSDGVTKLDHEIEDYIETSGELVAWVEVPTLDYNDDTELYIYYGNSSVEDQWNMEGTWDGNFEMVQHMDDLTTSSTEDSTSKNNDGTKTGTNEPDEDPGKIGEAQKFDGINDYLDVGAMGTFGSEIDEFTVEFWWKTNETGDITSPLKIIDDPDNSPSATDEVFGINTNRNLSSGCTTGSSAGDTLFQVRDTSANDFGKYISANLYDNEWHHIVWRMIDASNNSMEIYIDGSSTTLSGSCSESPSSFSNWSADTLAVGAANNRGSYSGYFEGLIDEVRISDTARTADWVATSYNNQNSPSGFYTVAGEDAVSSAFYAEFYNDSENSAVYSSNLIASSTTAYGRKRSSSLTMPSVSKIMDTRLEDSLAASSWLIIQISNLQIPENILFFIPLVLLIPRIMPVIMRILGRRRYALIGANTARCLES